MIEVSNISHSYNSKAKTEILHDISFKIPSGKFILILGQSGSGKTTLLNIIAGLLKPTSGYVKIDGKDIYSMKTKQLCLFRNKNIGFVFQSFFLENRFTTYENVMIPLLVDAKITKKEREKITLNVLNQVGLSEKVDTKPLEMSGGECQRVAIARALVNNPSYIIADEPTGNLDSINGMAIMKLLKTFVDEGKTVLMVTHNENYISFADIVFRVKDGIIYE